MSSTVRSRTTGSSSHRSHPASHASHASVSSTGSSSTLAGGERAASTAAGDEPRGPGEGQERREGWVVHAPLPAVKGTVGGINSPGRRHLHSPSLNSFRADSPVPYPSLPGTPTHPRAASPSRPPQTPQTPHAQSSGEDGAGDAPPASRRIAFNPDAPVFRADPTVKSCFDSLALDKAAELRSLFTA